MSFLKPPAKKQKKASTTSGCDEAEDGTSLALAARKQQAAAQFVASTGRAVLAGASDGGQSGQAGGKLQRFVAAGDSAGPLYSGVGGGSGLAEEGGGQEEEKAQPNAPLAAVDHLRVAYAPFRREFYAAAHELASMTPGAIAQKRSALELEVRGGGSSLSAGGVPAPLDSFVQAGFDKVVSAALQKYSFVAPTAIQAQALPVLLSGLDMIGIATTGSGARWC